MHFLDSFFFAHSLVIILPRLLIEFCGVTGSRRGEGEEAEGGSSGMHPEALQTFAASGISAWVVAVNSVSNTT